MELVSVVTPCYNASRFIADTIRSVQAQSYQNWEMLITDDCSTDNSRDIINEFAKKDPRIKLYKTELNSGHPSTPRNISLKHAKGEYVAFLDADDMWKHNKLEKHIAFIKQENCEISSTYCEIIDENGQQKGQIMRIKPKADYYDMLKNYELLSPTIICSKRIADKLYFPNCEQEDYVAWLSVLKYNIRGGVHHQSYGSPFVLQSCSGQPFEKQTAYAQSKNAHTSLRGETECNQDDVLRASVNTLLHQEVLHVANNNSFSVLMSVYAKENPSNLAEALDSVFNQTQPPTEVILVKDGPLTAELDNVLNKFSAEHSNLVLVPLAQNGGLGNALNEGLKHCQHDIVARMDTDDIAKPDRFEKQLKAMTERPEVDILSSWIEEFIGTKDNITSMRKLPETHQELAEFTKTRCPMNHPCVMFKKAAVEAVGGYKHFYLYEDYYLWVRMLKNGAVFYNIQESLLWFRSSRDVYKRRGGLKLACSEFVFRKYMHKIGMISFFGFWLSTPARFVIRIMPSALRKVFYQTILR